MFGMDWDQAEKMSLLVKEIKSLVEIEHSKQALVREQIKLQKLSLLIKCAKARYVDTSSKAAWFRECSRLENESFLRMRQESQP